MFTLLSSGKCHRHKKQSKMNGHEEVSHKKLPEILRGIFKWVPSRVGEIVRELIGTEIKARDACMDTPEILTRIFECLPLRDRKSVRLTCKLWMECCTRPEITTNEKIVLRAISDFTDIVRILQNWSHAQLNLEFQCIHVENIPTTAWKSFGQKIRTLSLLHCYFDEECARNIVYYCTNLASFGVFGHSPPFYRKDDNYNMLASTVFDVFVEQQIKRPTLRSLCVASTFPPDDVNEVPLSAHYLKNLLMVFPNLEHLQTRTGDHIPDNIRLNKKSNPIKKFTDLYYDPEFGSNSRNRALFDFCRVQEHLETVNLRTPTKELVFHVLENSKNLRELHIVHTVPFCDAKLTKGEVARFFALISKLRCLEISIIPRIESLPPSLPTYPNLNVLSLPLSEGALCVKLLKHCPALKHAQISPATDEVLQEIFENKPDLKTLILEITEDCTVNGFTDHSTYSMKRLQRLEHLELHDMTVEGKFIPRIVQDLQLPRLMYLKLYRIFKYFETTTSQLTQPSIFTILLKKANIPALETLEMDERLTTKNVNEAIKLCKKLKNLSHLILDHVDVTLQPLFEACPNLKYVSSSMKLTFFDRTTGTTRDKPVEAFAFSKGNNNLFSVTYNDDVKCLHRLF